MNNKFLKNKKADMISFNVVFHILEIIFFISVAVFVFFIVRVEKNINMFPVESEILFSRFLYENNGLWVYDEDIDRFYPGVLNFENFNDTQGIEKSLRDSIYYGDINTRAAAELILEDTDGLKFGPIYYNWEKYKEWIEWYKAGVITGAGARQGKSKVYNVLIKREDNLVPGFLNITVLIPNR